VIETTATDQVFSLEGIALDWHMDPLFGASEAEGNSAKWEVGQKEALWLGLVLAGALLCS
jgi:hypothetical protein